MERPVLAGADPIPEAQRRLFSPLRIRVLAQAADALAAGSVDAAEALVSKCLKRDPKSADALNLMADIARRQGRLEDAEDLLERCIERAPNSKGFRYNYALALKGRNKLKKADFQLDELLKTDPGNPLFREQKAKILSSMGRTEEAIVMRRGLVGDYPDVAGFWLLYGDVLRGPGHQEECIAAYRRALDIDPSVTEIYLRLCDLKTYRFTREEIGQMEAQLAVPGRTAEDRTNLHFALGKAYGDHKAYSKSFDNYQRGNALRRLVLGAGPGQISTHRANCESLFTPAFFQERVGWGCDSRAPIFIVGLPRSGSTLIEQILSSHSAIEGLGELRDLENVIVRRLCAANELEKPQSEDESVFETQTAFLRVYPQLFKRFTAGDYRSMGEEYLKIATSRRKLDTPFFTDKALSNFGQVGLIQLMLPNAKIVDARRHPLACGWSCFTNYFPNGMRFTYRLDDIAQHYANYVQLMAHFDRVLPGRVHRVIYEQIVADQEKQVRRLLNYLELPFEEQCLRFHENKRLVTTLSSEQVRKPLYKGGSEQWVPYEPWLGPLKAGLGPVLTEYPQVPDQDAAEPPGRQSEVSARA